MERVTAEIGIDYGHSVTMHGSKCRNLHGHRGRIIATVEGDIISDISSSSNGMVIDFGNLKTAMMEVIDGPYDHAFILWKEDPRAALMQQAHDLWHGNEEKFHLVDFIPTAENLAAYWFKLLENHLEMKYHIKLQSLQVYETPTSSAIYSRPAPTFDVKIPTRLTVDGDVVVHGNLTVDDTITSVRFNSEFKPAAFEERE